MANPRATTLALPVQFPSCPFPVYPMLPSLTLSGLFIGQLAHLPGDGTPTGMYKQPVDEAWATVDGLRGDVQADRRFHGGPDKAIHHYPAEHYAQLAAHAPQAAAALRAGVLGENLSTTGWDETCVCLGDCYQVGEALLQVTQPRKPCWKINARLEVEQLSMFIAEHSLTGWYCAVRQPGRLWPGAPVTLVSRPADTLSLAQFNALQAEHRPDPARLRTVAAIDGLAADVAQRLRERAAWLDGLRAG